MLGVNKPPGRGRGKLARLSESSCCKLGSFLRGGKEHINSCMGDSRSIKPSCNQRALLGLA
jgi:hypothetical protein